MDGVRTACTRYSALLKGGRVSDCIADDLTTFIAGHWISSTTLAWAGVNSFMRLCAETAWNRGCQEAADHDRPVTSDLETWPRCGSLLGCAARLKASHSASDAAEMILILSRDTCSIGSASISRSTKREFAGIQQREAWGYKVVRRRIVQADCHRAVILIRPALPSALWPIIRHVWPQRTVSF